MIRYIKRNLFPIALCSFILQSCYNDKAESLYGVKTTTTCDTTNITFSGNIQPILSQNCATTNCHDAATKTSGYNFSEYSSVYSAAILDIKLIGSITHASGFQAMPQNAPKLKDCDINKITAWVNNGAPNN